MSTERGQPPKRDDSLVHCVSCRGETLEALCTFVAGIGWLCRPCFGKYYRVLGRGGHHWIVPED